MTLMAKQDESKDHTPKKPKSSGFYMKQMRTRLTEQGFVPRDVWVLPENSKILKQIEKRLRQPLIAGVDNLETLMSFTQTWNTKSLFEALSGDKIVVEGDVEVKLVGAIDQSIHVTVKNHGDLPVFVAVNGEQILVEASLFPVSAIANVAEFNDVALRSRSMFPLSSLAIEKDGYGEDQYVMYGALSASSPLENIVTEIETLAENILNAAEAFESFYKK